MGTSENKYLFSIPVGDFSDDGHGKCEYYEYSSNKPIEDIREAYFSAKEKLGKAYPEIVCENHEENTVDEDLQDELEALGFQFDDNEESPYCLVDNDMLKLTEWFLKQGDNDLILERKPEKYVPMLQFYGYDKQGRHIGGIGYGITQEC